MKKTLDIGRRQYTTLRKFLDPHIHLPNTGNFFRNLFFHNFVPCCFVYSIKVFQGDLYVQLINTFSFDANESEKLWAFKRTTILPNDFFHRYCHFTILKLNTGKKKLTCKKNCCEAPSSGDILN